jgi:hypothetical protein
MRTCAQLSSILCLAWANKIYQGILLGLGASYSRTTT